MCVPLQKVVEYLATIDFSATVQGVGAIWVAVVASMALSTWRRQLHAQKQLAFIDEITDTVHEFILLMSAPVSQLTFAKIGIESYVGIAFGYEKYENSESIAFIEKKGQDTSKRIWEQLRAVKPVLSKMQSLVVKGQVFGIKNYSKCQNACGMLEWSHNQIEAFCSIIGSPHMNWENPMVQKSLGNLSKIDPDNIKANLAEQNKELILFVKSAYENVIK